jgi:CheY-like chemotaxis protein
MFEILLVDDDRVALMLHKRVLERQHLEMPIRQFSEGADALAFIEQPENKKKNFLMLLDINMPQMSGWDVLDYLAKTVDLPNIMVFMVTSSVDLNDKLKADNCKLVLGYIEKPVTSHTIEFLMQHPLLMKFF